MGVLLTNQYESKILGVPKSIDSRAVVDNQEGVKDLDCYEGMTFYDKDKKELVVVSEVTEDGDFVASTKLLDSTSEEGLRKLIADASHRNHLISRVPLCA